MSARLLVAALGLVGYLLAARGVENLYPFSTFPMYSGDAPAAVARLMVKDGGDFREIGDFSAWKCDNLPHLADLSCGDARGIDYLDADREAFIRSHAGEGGRPVELVQRVFSFDGNPRQAYCVVTRCSAR